MSCGLNHESPALAVGALGDLMREARARSMIALLRRASRHSSDHKVAAADIERADAARRPDRSPSTPAAELATERTPTPRSRWGRNLLAGVGIALTLTGIVIVLLPFVTHTSGLAAAPGTAILAGGVMLVVMSAYYGSTRGVGRVPGWIVHFGRTENADADAQSREKDGCD